MNWDTIIIAGMICFTAIAVAAIIANGHVAASKKKGGK